MQHGVLYACRTYSRFINTMRRLYILLKAFCWSYKLCLVMLVSPVANPMPTWSPQSSLKGLSSWLLWRVVDKDIPLFQFFVSIIVGNYWYLKDRDNLKFPPCIKTLEIYVYLKGLAALCTIFPSIELKKLDLKQKTKYAVL